jgi:hypothetical protein
VKVGDFILFEWKISEPAVTVLRSSEVLGFYCHLLCSTDIAAGFVLAY